VEIGRRGHRILYDDALDHVGATASRTTCGPEHPVLGEQWTRAKGYDTFCPSAQSSSGLELAPAAAPRVAAAEPRGALGREHERPDLRRAFLVAYVSKVFTLEPAT